MLLACNLLKAIGGSPAIDSRDFVPPYPTNLPGTVADDLIVPLAPFSHKLARDVFMRIEQPQQVLDFQVAALTSAPAPAKTIGEFYGRIREVFANADDKFIVDKTGETQPTHFALPSGIQKITSRDEALAAIDLIVEQGEGTETEPTFPDGDSNPADDELAHYYKFAEIVRGRLKANPNATPASPPNERYIYDAADPVPFDEAAVLPLRSNPKRDDYAAGSPARQAIDDFNRSYTEVLRQLHAAFNNQPAQIFDAVDSMNGMGRLAAKIVEIELEDGTRPGPTFEYFAEPVS